MRRRVNICIGIRHRCSHNGDRDCDMIHESRFKHPGHAGSCRPQTGNRASVNYFEMLRISSCLMRIYSSSKCRSATRPGRDNEIKLKVT